LTDYTLGERKRQKIAELEAKVQSVQAESTESSSPEQRNPIESTVQLDPDARQSTEVAPLSEPQLSVWSTIPETQLMDLQLSTDYSASANSFSDLSGCVVQNSGSTSLPTPSGSDDFTAHFDSISTVNSTGNFRFITGQGVFPIDSADGEQATLSGASHANLNTTELGTAGSDSNDMSQLCPSFSPTAVMTRQSPDFGWPSPPTPMNTTQSGPYLTVGVMNDVGNLDVPMLKVMKAGKLIADMLDCTNHIWDPFFQHVVRIQPPDIPQHFKPTKVQLHIPHHPVFDVLPWPSARTKFICIFSQPVETRPPSARDPLAVVHLLMDIDDESEGMRISGENGWDWRNWEVGEKFFRNWWWALDREIVENSNRLRAERGAGRLRLKEV